LTNFVDHALNREICGFRSGSWFEISFVLFFDIVPSDLLMVDLGLNRTIVLNTMRWWKKEKTQVMMRAWGSTKLSRNLVSLSFY